MMSYDKLADGPHQHTWWVNDYSGQWEKTVFFPAATDGMDTNTTIEVCSWVGTDKNFVYRFISRI